MGRDQCSRSIEPDKATSAAGAFEIILYLLSHYPLTNAYMLNVPAVWVVDDDEDDQFLLSVAFKNFTPPVPIKQLYDGEELLPNLEAAASLPQLVLLDLNMTRKNGFETLVEIRSFPKYKNLPVIVLTTSSMESDKTLSYSLGADGFLTKPHSNEDTVIMLKLLALEWLQ